MAWWFILILVLVVALIFVTGIFWWGFKRAVMLALNSIIGFFALYAVQLWRTELVINLWSVLITAILGIFGFIIVLVLHFLGIAF